MIFTGVLSKVYIPNICLITCAADIPAMVMTVVNMPFKARRIFISFITVPTEIFIVIHGHFLILMH